MEARNEEGEVRGGGSGTFGGDCDVLHVEV